jgi:hypothetical protein
MDPTACFHRFLDAEDLGQRDEARAAAQDLVDWLRRGGFEPEWSHSEERAFWRRAAALGVRELG